MHPAPTIPTLSVSTPGSPPRSGNSEAVIVHVQEATLAAD